MLWSAGLRGAVAFGLVLQLRPTPGPDQAPQEGLPAIEAATLVIVVISTLVFGTATGPLLRHLNLEARTRQPTLVFIHADNQQEAGKCKTSSFWSANETL